MFYSFYSYEKLNEAEKYYDKECHLLRICKPDGTHIHPISISLDYALYLLYTSRASEKKRALEIIDEVLKFCCIDEKSNMLGIFAESKESMICEELEKNAENNSKIAIVLVQLLRDYKEVLPRKTVKLIKAACINAIFAVSDRKKYESVYAAQMAYSALVCGELCRITEYIKYGEMILKKLWLSDVYQSSVSNLTDIENGIRTIRCLSLLEKSTKNKECIEISGFMLDKMWKTWAKRFHFKMKRLTGPFSNVLYKDDKEVNNFLYGALNRKIDIPHFNESPEELASCPAKYYPYFKGEKSVEFQQEIVSFGQTFPKFMPSVTATTYIRPGYALGSFNRSKFFRNERGFSGFFGVSEEIFDFRMDVLYKGNSYPNACLHSIQQKGYLLGHISFISNIYKDLEKITDKLKIRFSITGKTENLKIKHIDNSFSVKYGELELKYEVTYIRFTGLDVEFILTEEENFIALDTVISGIDKIDAVHILQQAIIEFSFIITSTEKTVGKITRTEHDGILISKAEPEGIELMLQTLVKPLPEIVVLSDDRQSINNMQLEEYVIHMNEKMKSYALIENARHEKKVTFPFYDPNVEKSVFTYKIENIKQKSIKDLLSYTQGIMSEVIKADYSLELQKRLALQIVANMFECAKNNDYSFNKIINQKYHDIFRKIAVADTSEAIDASIRGLCIKMQKDKHIIESKNRNERSINEVIQLVDENLLNPNLSLQFVADRMGHSMEYVSRQFTDVMGMNYLKYVQKRKVEWAISQFNNMSIKEISEALGYSNQESFMRMFKNAMGSTIAQYLAENKHD